MKRSFVNTTLFALSMIVLALLNPAYAQESGAGSTQPSMETGTSAGFDAAMKLYRQRRYNQAIEAFDAVLQSEPGNAAAHYFKGYAQYVTGQHEQSVASFSQAFQANPTFDPRPFFHRR